MPDVFKNGGSVCTTSDQTVYTVPGIAGGVQRAIIFLIQCANVDIEERTVTIWWKDASNSNAERRLVFEMPIPDGAAVNVLGGKLVLEAGDSLHALASANSSIELSLAFIESSA